MTGDFAVGLQSWQAFKQKEKEEGFWTGHSLFQIPARILEYRGKAESLVLAYLYEKANGISFYSASAVVIEVHTSERTIAARTGLGKNAVSYAIVSLEADQAIRVSRRRDPKTKQIRLNVYLLLHSETKDPLVSAPGEFGVCKHNYERPYITAPKETRTHLQQMKPGSRAVYLSALALASERLSTSFGILRNDWKSASRLGRNSFDRGVTDCVRRKLLTYKRRVLALMDPVTGAPTQRSAHEFVKHDNPRWKFDLNSVTSEQWRQIVQELLKCEFVISHSGWSWTQRGLLCPFCKEEKCFTVSFAKQQYNCFNSECTQRKGRLCQLVARVLRVPMRTATDYVREHVTQDQKAA